MNEKSLVTPNNEFYRNTYPQVLRLIILLIFLGIVLLMGISLKIFFPSQAKYYIVLQGNKDQPIRALGAPIVSKGEILRWASQSVITIYNFDFSNWEVRLNEAAPLFTANGFGRFQDALKLEGALAGIIRQKLQVTAVVANSPVITAEGLFAGRYTWKVNMPVLLTYTSSSEVRQRSVLVTMLISRIPVLDSPRGYAIEQFYEESL